MSGFSLLDRMAVASRQRAAVDIANEVLAALKGEPLRWRVI